KFRVGAATGPAHIHNAGGKTRHDLGTRAARQADIVLRRVAVSAAERKTGCVKYRGREGVVLSERNPLISRSLQFAEERVVPQRIILRRIVYGVAGKESVV